MRLEISDRATRDIEGILAHGRRVYGAEVAQRYVVALTEALDHLREWPRIGHPSDEIGPGVRRLRVGTHWLLYRIHDEQTIRI